MIQKSDVIKCDYCDVTEPLGDRVPEGWFSGWMRKSAEDISELVKGPTVCPFHHESLKLFFKGGGN